MLANILNKIKIGYEANKFDIIVVSLIILSILLAMGIWRLEKARPEKEPIRLSHNISFMSLASDIKD